MVAITMVFNVMYSHVWSFRFIQLSVILATAKLSNSFTNPFLAKTDLQSVRISIIDARLQADILLGSSEYPETFLHTTNKAATNGERVSRYLLRENESLLPGGFSVGSWSVWS